MEWFKAGGDGNLRRWMHHFPLRRCLEVAAILVLLIVAYSTFSATNRLRNGGDLRSGRCNFPAIFNFGDSNSDTGGKSAAFHRLPSPNGKTFFGKPSGRYCDGKVIIDFIAERLGLPYLSAYLDSIGANFRHGANFATAGSTIQPLDSTTLQGFSPISLDIQLLQFEQFKARTLELHNEDGSSYAKASLPNPEDFSNALYTIDIGQNDLHAALGSIPEKEVLESLPRIIAQLNQAIEKLYHQGARAFWIHNTGPIGCLPYSIIFYPPKPNNTDQNGCIVSHNGVAQEFNRHLKASVSQLRLQLKDVTLNYIDIYSAKYTLITEAQNHGFANPLEYCCGHYGDYRVQCGRKAIVNGTEVSGTPCPDPLKVISWDAVHYSHAANQWVANRILDVSFSDIQVAIAESCPG